MIHNIVTYHSKAYKAVKPKSDSDRCIGCKFDMDGFSDGCRLFDCTPRERLDGNHVIYKPHYRLGVKK